MKSSARNLLLRFLSSQKPWTEPAQTPKEIIPEYYEEQPDIPTVDSITIGSKASKNAFGPAPNGKYLELCYGYRSEQDDKASVEAIAEAYAEYVSENGFSVKEISLPDEYAALNAESHQSSDPNEKEIFHILKATEVRAVLTINEEDLLLRLYLMDAWKEGQVPAPTVNTTPKDTAYKTGTVYLVARNEDLQEDHELHFTDGVLTAHYIENMDGKGGYGGETALGIDCSEFYGLTVEEATAILESRGYTVTIGDDLYDTLLKALGR